MCVAVPHRTKLSFKHALIQEAAYGTLLRVTRQDYHRRVAAALERQSANLAKTDAALLAHHYAEGGMLEPAIRYFRQAGDTAVEASALTEAIDNFAKGLALLEHLPEGPERAREEITIQLALGGAQILKIGPRSAEVERTYLRLWSSASDLGPRRIGSRHCGPLVPPLPADIYGCREYGDELPLAEKLADPTLLLEAHHVQWGTQASTGNFRKALAHTEEGIARYDCNEHHRLTFVYGGHDTGVCARNVNADALCFGISGASTAAKPASLSSGARELGHPLTLEFGYLFALVIGLLVRNLSKVEQHTSDFAELVRGGKLPEEASGNIAEGFRGWMIAEGGRRARSRPHAPLPRVLAFILRLVLST